MKIKDCFVSHETEGHHMLISTDPTVFSGMLKLNTVGAFIVDQLANETTKEAILCEMKKKYKGDETLMAEDIDKIISTLRKIGALDE